MDFKQVVFTDKKRFCIDEPDNISSYIDHRNDSAIALHRGKHQMDGGYVVILGASSALVILW